MTDMDEVVKAIGANYAVWNEDTTITLCSVRWDSQYRNIVKFANKTALNNYLDSSQVLHTNIGKARYVKADEPIRLPLPIDKVYPYNYVRVHNPRQAPVNGEELYYYYFIVGVEFSAPGVTTIQVQLDVWQTFGDKAKFSSAFVEQGHIGVANSKQFDDFGRKYLTTPEGLDTGAEMVAVATATHSIMERGNNPSVAMVCAGNILVDPETSDGKPELSVSEANYVQGMLSGVATYFFKTLDDYVQFTRAYAQYTWILSSIKSVTLIPNAFSNGEQYQETKLAKGNVSVYRQINSAQAGKGKYVTMRENFRDQISNAIPARYRGLKKMLTYPYCVIEMTLFNGSNTVLKPENIPSADAKVAIKSSNLTPGQKLMAYVRGYNARFADQDLPSNGERYYDGGDYLENAVVMDNYPTLALVGDAGNLSLAQNFNAIAQQRKTADWSQQKALRGNSTSFDNNAAANSNTERQGYLQQYGIQARNDNANRTTAARAAVGSAAALGTGNVMGAVTGAGNGVIDIINRGRETDISLAQSRESVKSNVGTSQQIANNNYALGEFAARGDYQTAIAEINAKVQDTGLTPPFAVGAAGGESFLFTMASGIQLYFIMKTISPGEMMRIGEYWLRFGYAVNTFVRTIPEDLMCMTNFTYWRFSETQLIASHMPEWVKNVIRGIFEKGVTVWSDPAKIGSIDIADNVAKTGISY